jgi:hypothetical protein
MTLEAAMAAARRKAAGARRLAFVIKKPSISRSAYLAVLAYEVLASDKIIAEVDPKGKVKLTHRNPPRKNRLGRTMRRNPVSEVATEIFRQLGGNKFLAMTGGQASVEGNTLIIKLPARGLRGYGFTITLNAMDTYDVKFVKLKRNWEVEERTATNVYAEDLRGIIEHETGLRTSLENPGRAKRNPLVKGKSRTMKLKQDIWLFSSGNDQTHTIYKAGTKVKVFFHGNYASVYDQAYGRYLEWVRERVEWPDYFSGNLSGL